MKQELQNYIFQFHVFIFKVLLALMLIVFCVLWKRLIYKYSLMHAAISLDWCQLTLGICYWKYMNFETYDQLYQNSYLILTILEAGVSRKVTSFNKFYSKLSNTWLIGCAAV